MGFESPPQPQKPKVETDEPSNALGATQEAIDTLNRHIDGEAQFAKRWIDEYKLEVNAMNTEQLQSEIRENARQRQGLASLQERTRNSQEPESAEAYRNAEQQIGILNAKDQILQRKLEAGTF